MYWVTLAAHSWLRWAALSMGALATLAALRDRGEAGGPGPADRWGLGLMVVLDMQMLLGLLLYLAVSPNMEMIRTHFGEALRNASLRFWAVEHIGAMLGAVALVHIGRAAASHATTAAVRRRWLLACFALATITMFVATPWPGTLNGRPLFRI
jgi:hypothetical protein